jgi:hypothetical protein
LIPERNDEDDGLSVPEVCGRIFLGVDEIDAGEFREVRAALPEDGYPETLRLPGESDRPEVCPREFGARPSLFGDDEGLRLIREGEAVPGATWLLPEGLSGDREVTLEAEAFSRPPRLTTAATLGCLAWSVICPRRDASDRPRATREIFGFWS